jgi:acyl-CoA synthetase (AMP-forming)/AMP-acid ligase II
MDPSTLARVNARFPNTQITQKYGTTETGSPRSVSRGNDGDWIRFRGRAADTINVGGEKVAPTEVEQSILELDFVRDVVVSGEPHAPMGQIGAARVGVYNKFCGSQESRRTYSDALPRATCILQNTGPS